VKKEENWSFTEASGTPGKKKNCWRGRNRPRGRKFDSKTRTTERISPGTKISISWRLGRKKDKGIREPKY